MLSSSSSLFDTLPQRPPTPPRDLTAADEDAHVVDDALHFLENGHQVDTGVGPDRALDKKIALAAPAEQSPTSSQAASCTGRKVEFSPFPKFHEIARLGQISSPSHQLSKRSPLNRYAKPRRSILKPSSYVQDPPTPDEIENTLGYFSPQDPSTFGKMLQSVIQHLGGRRLDARLDGYLALNNAIKAYDGAIPDVQAMASKMDIIMQFLARDIVCKGPGGVLDTNMVTQSLKVVAAIMFVPTLLEAWDDDFRAFLVDRSTAVMESTDTSKSIVKMHMFILAHQRFRSSSVMTSARADRIITTLRTIEDRCSGNSAVATRLIVYLRLLDQAPAVMMARSRDWLEHTFHGMLSSIKEIRIRAIELCHSAGLFLGQHPHGFKPIRDMLETEMEEGKTYGDYLNDRLLQMISDPEAGASVPQMWASVLLFFRYKRSNVERWPRFKTWLMIIQKCLNSSDINIKYAANKAWNQLVFIVMPDGNMSATMRTMLRAPIVAGFRRRNNDKHAQQERFIATETYYNLLHYSLRPGLSHQEIDSAWETYVDTILPERCAASMKGRTMALQLLRGLLTPSPGAWNLNAANEPEPIKPADLPQLDPRWVRSRLSEVLKVITPALSDSMFKIPELNEELDMTLQALYTCIAEAASQEVKTSGDLKEAIAVLVDVFRQVWQVGVDVPANKVSAFIKRYTHVVSEAVRTIGSNSCAEDILTKAKDDATDVVYTPSNRPSKHHTSPYSPLLALFNLLYHAPASFINAEQEMSGLGRTLLELLTSSKSNVAQIEVLSRLIPALSTLTQSSDVRCLCALLWSCIGNCASMALGAFINERESNTMNPVGHQLRSINVILASGLSLVADHSSCLTAVLKLYDAQLSLAKSQAGVGGATVAAAEPLASHLIELPPSVPIATKLAIASHLLNSLIWPKSAQDLDQARRVIWGVGLATSKSPTFEPLSKTSHMIVRTLICAYESLDTVLPTHDSEIALAFLDTSLGFLTTCPNDILAPTLSVVQHGFVPWLEDYACKTSSETASKKINSLFTKLLQLIASLPQHDSATVESLEPLLITAFVSPHRCVVNNMILFWNRTFGSEQQLAYPLRLERTLRARSLEADIILPDFPQDNGQYPPAMLPAFYEITENYTVVEDPSKSKPGLLDDCEVDLGSKKVVSPAVQEAVKNARTTNSLQNAFTRPSAPSIAKSRLRHEDSQMEFALIDSSPRRQDDESQHLTEHQKEMLDEQRESAQMFQDFSSSPLAEPITRPNGIPKRLEFISDLLPTSDDAEHGTPRSIPDVNGIMSDDMPSSPTPSSSKVGPDSSHLLIQGDEDDADRYGHDPPSSPPRRHDQSSNKLAVHDEDFSEPEEDVYEIVDDGLADQTIVDAASIDEAMVDDGDRPLLETPQKEDVHFPSDSVLPSAQLQAEEEAAVAATAANVDDVDVTEQGLGGEQHERHDDHSSTSYLADMPDELTGSTRVEDSFVIFPAADNAEEVAESMSLEADEIFQDPDQTPRKSKKRKRAAGTVYTTKATKKRKSQSPMKYASSLIASLLGRRSQEEAADDEYIEEEIIVATRQPSVSPTKPVTSRITITKEPDCGTVSSTEHPLATTIDEVGATPTSPHKRRSGRSRKSLTPACVSSQPLVSAQPTILKRKASVLSLDDSEVKDAGVEQGMIAPPRTRMQSQAASQQLLSDDNAGTTRSTIRRLASVDIPMNNGTNDTNPETLGRDCSEAHEHNAELDTNAAASHERSAYLEDRKIATPRSIIGMLRNALGVLSNSTLRSEEAREMDDVLFELKKEMHEAAKRESSS